MNEQPGLFALSPPSRWARRRRPPRQTSVIVTAEAIAAAMAGQTGAEGPSV
jgi:hypothetical protein